ncbi:MAG: DUF58 domain-containing protein [Lachnospira sp.]|nr:DUF58 domain-containing protein [Lachnospira sp.]
MRKRQIIYICMFLCVLAMNFIFPDYLPFMLLWIMLLIPVMMLGFGFIMKKNIQVKFHVDEKNAIRGLPVHYQVQVHNAFIFAVENLRMTIQCRYHNLKQPIEYEHTMMLQALHTEELEDTYRIAYSGRHETSIGRIRFSDPLHLFVFHIKCNDCCYVDTMPVLHQPDQMMLYSGQDEISEAFEFSNNRSGDDSSEIFDVRAYHGGDFLNRIHWKLSAREDELMVKEFSLPISRSNCIVVELPLCENPDDRRNLDGIYEMAYAVMNFALLKEQMIDVLYVDDGLMKHTIETKEDCEEAVLELLQAESSDEGTCLSHFLEEADSYEKVFYITDRMNYQLMEYLNSSHDCCFTCFYIGYDNIMGETSTFEGGRLNSINPEEIRQGLGAVFL